jgi:thiamine-monophosphate kinase
MIMDEFSIIERYFKNIQAPRKDVLLGIGDDCALCDVPEGQALAVSMDTFVADVHFPADAHPSELCHKVVAASLSDLAAIGAEPCWLTLGLTLPEISENWLSAFSSQLQLMAEHYDCTLIGGDITKGPLTISLQVHGLVPAEYALKRKGAKAGDLIYVTGFLGDAGFGLDVLQNKVDVPVDVRVYALSRYYCPSPRLAAGIALRGLATSCIDISDGLLADLTHILKASDVGARLHIDKLPLSQPLLYSQGDDQARKYALTSGDDYELCFTVADDKADKLEKHFATAGCKYHCIGRIVPKPGIVLLENDKPVDLELGPMGYKHFS